MLEPTAAPADKNVCVVLVGSGTKDVNRCRRDPAQHVHEYERGKRPTPPEIHDGAVRRSGCAKWIGQEVAE